MYTCKYVYGLVQISLEGSDWLSFIYTCIIHFRCLLSQIYFSLPLRVSWVSLSKTLNSLSIPTVSGQSLFPFLETSVLGNP